MKVIANVQPVVKDYTFTLSPAEVDSLRAVLTDSLDRGGPEWYFTSALRTSIDTSKAAASTSDAPKTWFDAGNGDAELLASRKITAIKDCRRETGCGLKEAKDAADARARWLGV